MTVRVLVAVIKGIYGSDEGEARGGGGGRGQSGRTRIVGIIECQLN